MTLEHALPVRRGDEVVHRRWAVDIAAAARAAGIPVDRMTREATEMARHFPRWVLVLVRDGRVLHCKCDGVFVFDGGSRCAACGKTSKDARTAHAGWFGLLPPIGLDGLPVVKRAIVERPPRRHVVGHAEALGTYVLVPLVVQYASGFPRTALDVHYLPEFRDIPGVPRDEYSHTFHMIGATRMCLFAPGDWREELTAREVLQQRAYPHVIKFLNYANGKRDAFAIVTR